MKKNQILTWIGIFFLLFQAFQALGFGITGHYVYLVWFCNHAALLIGIACLMKNRMLLTIEATLLIAPQALWTLDFFSRLLTGHYIVKITEYMFEPGYPIISYLSSLEHLFMYVLVIYALKLAGGPVKNAWIWSSIYGVTLFAISKMFIDAQYNINCAHVSCLPFLPTNAWYFLLKPTLYILLVIIPTNYLLWKFMKHKRKK